MKKLAVALLALFAVGSLIPLTAQESKPTSQPTMSHKEKVSYAIGFRMGMNIARQGGGDIDLEVLIRALRSSVSGKKPDISFRDMDMALQRWQQESQMRAQKRVAELAKKNKEQGEAYLAKNAKEPGWVVTASGLQYKVLKQGDGPKPKARDTVEVHYHGTLIDGTVFDSSVQKGQPFTTAVTGVIKGWIEALQLMNVGSKYKLVIPSNIAYGQSPRAPGGPNSVLVFEVELLKIK